MGKSRNSFFRKEIYSPEGKLPFLLSKIAPKHLTPGKKYEIIREGDARKYRFSNCFSRPFSLTEDTISYMYYVKDDLGRIISVPAFFFENDDNITLLHEQPEDEFYLTRDYTDIRNEFLKKELKYTENITFADFGIDPTRMTPDEAKIAWNKILKSAAGVERRFNDDLSFNMNIKLEDIEKVMKELQIKISEAKKLNIELSDTKK